MRNVGLDETQAGIKIAERNINNLRYAGKDWRWEEKGMTEDELVGWHHRLNGHEFE